MPVAPTGPESLLVNSLENLVANSDQFQDWVGEANAAAAKNHIYPLRVDGAIVVASRPFALIADGSISLRSVAGGTGKQFEANGELFLLFEDEIAAENEDNAADAYYAFTNRTGQVMKEMLALSATDDGSNQFLVMEGVEKQGSWRSGIEEEDDQGSYYQTIYSIQWRGIY